MELDLSDVLALSNERDQWMARLLDAEREAYRRGYADGRRDQIRSDDRVWAARPLTKVSFAVSFADLEVARWSREHFGDQEASDVRGAA